MNLFNVVPDYNLINRFRDSLNSDKLKKEIQFNVLISFPYIKGNIKELSKLRDKKIIQNLFLDAGTFTLNQPIPDPRRHSRFNEYVNYVNIYHEHFDLIASYDEDFDVPELNQMNLLRQSDILLKNGMKEEVIQNKLLPVIHESKHEKAAEEIQAYVDLGFKYLAIGSRPKIEDAVWKEINRHRDVADEKRKIKIHLFGKTSPKYLIKWKPDSCDSASYAKTSAFNEVSRWYEKDEMIEKLPLSEENIEKEVAIAFNDHIKKHFNFDIYDTLVRAEYRQITNLFTMLELEKYVTDVKSGAIKPKS